MCSISQDAQYWRGTSSVLVKMCNISEAYLQYLRRGAVLARNIKNNGNVIPKMCLTNTAHPH